MRWIGPTEGDYFDKRPSSSAGANPLHQLRLAWIESLVENGDYDSADVLSQALEKMIGETA